MGGADSWHPNLDLQRGRPPPGIQAAPPPRKLRPKPGGRRKCEPCSPVTHIVLWGKSTLTPVRLPPGDHLPWVSLFKTLVQFSHPHPSFLLLEMFAGTCLGPQESLGR